MGLNLEKKKYIVKWYEYPTHGEPFGRGGWSSRARYRPRPVLYKTITSDVVFSGKSVFVNGQRKLKVNIYLMDGTPVREDYRDIKFNPDDLKEGLDEFKKQKRLISKSILIKPMLQHQLYETKKLDTGKLKLLEVLTMADIQTIKTLAATEADKVKSELRSTIEKVEKDLSKHVQDKDLHLKEKDVKDIIKPEIDDAKKELNTKFDDKVTKIEKTIDTKIEKMVDSRELEKKVKEMIADVMMKYHQALWIKRSFWKNELTK